MATPVVHLMSFVKYKPTQVRVALLYEACLDQVYTILGFFQQMSSGQGTPTHIRVHALVDDTHL
jgi:hypothetical protein